MHRLTGILLSIVLFGCASVPEQEPAPQETSAPNLSQFPEVRQAQATGALLSKATGAEKTNLSLKGKCEIAVPNSQISRPCQNVKVKVTDVSGEEVGIAVLERGKFSVSVPKVEDYFIQVQIENGGDEDQEREPMGPFRPDDNILIKLNQRQP